MKNSGEALLHRCFFSFIRLLKAFYKNMGNNSIKKENPENKPFQPNLEKETAEAVFSHCKRAKKLLPGCRWEGAVFFIWLFLQVGY